jgi:hypothetical protein
MNIFLALILIALLTVFSVDVRQKRHNFLREKSTDTSR